MTQFLRICVLFVLIAGCARDRSRPDAGVESAPSRSDASSAATTRVAPGATTRPARAVVVWISIDGFRHDYIDRGHAPFLAGLMNRGAFSRKLTPSFPSLTFPSHVSQATGAPASMHGVPANRFFDPATAQVLTFPNDAAYLQSEPIWITAPRQGVRTAVYDWPLSQKQTGAVRSDYFHDQFDNRPSDEERLERLTKTWEDDANANATTGAQDNAHATPLRLLMTYVHATDTAGHRFGPDSPRVDEAVAATDALLAKYVARWKQLFDRTMSPADELYVLFTTDHGMSPVTAGVDLPSLLGGTNSDRLRLVTGGAIANVHLDKVPEADRGAVAAAIRDEVCCVDFARAYLKSELPPKWGYAHPSRVGDVVITLSPGYTFVGGASGSASGSRGDATTRPTTRPAPSGGPRGMHGYDVDEDPNMLGFFLAWRHRTPMPGTDLGTLDALRIHPTVCKLLGIAPAPNATGVPIELPSSAD